MTKLSEAALEYADADWPIFPLRPRGKEPLTKHGFKDATSDLTIVELWWNQWPNANIGLWCRDFTVLDVDPRNHGYDELERYISRHGADFKETVTCLTGGDGAHYYFRGTTAMTKLAPGIDVKSQGGYVILPPSIHPSGKEYAWEYEPGEVPMLEIPQWLRATKSPETAKIYELADIPEGDRDDTLVRIAGRMRQIGGYIGEVDTIEGALERINLAYCKPPLSPADVHRLAYTAARWPSGDGMPTPEA